MRPFAFLVLVATFLSFQLPRAAAQSPSAWDLLPAPGDVPSGFEVTEEGNRSLAEHAESFPDPGSAREFLAARGWAENAFRFFAIPAPDGDPVPPAYVQASVTRFATAAGASAALPFFARSRAGALGHEPAAAAAVGDEALVVSGPVAEGHDVTLYARHGPFLLRVSQAAGDGDPAANPGRIAAAMIARSAGSPATAADQWPVDGLLPPALPLDHGGCFGVVDEGVLDFAAVAERFPGVPDAAGRLRDLGWRAGAFRQFGCDGPPPGAAGWIDAAVHRFGAPAGARAAVRFFADARLLGSDLALVDRPGITESADALLALSGPAVNGTEYTLYASTGAVLFRVTGVSPDGEPAADVWRVAEALLVAAAPAPAPTPVPAPSPTPTAPPRPTTETVREATVRDVPCGAPIDDMAAQAGAEPGAVAPFFGCRQLESGEWVEAVIGDDRPFVHHPPGINPEDVPGIDAGRERLLRQVEGLASFPAVTQYFWYAIDERTLYVTGSGEAIPYDGNSLKRPGNGTFLGAARLGYDPAVRSYLRVPANAELAAYVGWFVGNRDYYIELAYNEARQHPTMAEAGRSSLDYGWVPFPWELADPFIIDQYLIELAIAAGSVGDAGQDP